MSATRLLQVLAMVVLAVVAACGGRGPVASHPGSPPVPLASVSIETEGHASLPQYVHAGAIYVAGQAGQRYDIRITNHAPTRIEAVVSVDGRDVVSGEVGSFRERGYVIERGGSTVIAGFRRSLDDVAAFRFTDLEHSYAARRGTPENVGVIGVAIFKEKSRRPSRRRQAIAVGTAPRPQPEPFAGGKPGRVAKRPPAGDAEAPADDAGGAQAEAAPASAPGARHDGRFAAEPEPRNELGTEYGESVSSPVYELKFKRHNKRRPDEIVTIYYDSPRGLERRGVIGGHPDHAGPG